jgi:hypothetical protein
LTPPARTTTSVDRIADRITASESALSTRLRAFHPIVRSAEPDDGREGGPVLIPRRKLLGQFDWAMVEAEAAQHQQGSFQQQA